MALDGEFDPNFIEGLRVPTVSRLHSQMKVCVLSPLIYFLNFARQSCCAPDVLNFTSDRQAHPHTRPLTYFSAISTTMGIDPPTREQAHLYLQHCRAKRDRKEMETLLQQRLYVEGLTMMRAAQANLAVLREGVLMAEKEVGQARYVVRGLGDDPELDAINVDFGSDCDPNANDIRSEHRIKIDSTGEVGILQEVA